MSNKTVYYGLLVLSLLAVSVGGFIDLKSGITKQHMWSDALYLLVLMLVLKVVFKL